MIDMSLLRENPEQIGALIKIKDPEFDVEKLVSLDKQLRSIRLDLEALRSQKNDLAKKGQAGLSPQLREQSIEIGKQVKEKEKLLESAEQQYTQLLLSCPNLPDQSVPLGGKEANREISKYGEKPIFNFEPKHHLELGEKLGWLDFEVATKISGANFALYKNDAVRLLYSLAMFMLKNNAKHGFQFVLPPLLLNERSLEVTGNFPRFKDQVFAIPEDGLFLSPTSEVNLTNMYRDQIVMKNQLPIRMTAFTSCFRREGGGYGASERGIIRMRQFEKVEIVSICDPEKSYEEHERMLACAEDILKQLGLHYRVVLLAGQDASFSSAKTYDIEVWLPGQNEYKEVSSISNCTDFQARRGLIRFKETLESKTQLAHTLNGSSLALPRLMVAIMETYQKADGTITIPDVLKKEGLF